MLLPWLGRVVTTGHSLGGCLAALTAILLQFEQLHGLKSALLRRAHTHTHARTHTHAHTRTHTRTHTHSLSLSTSLDLSRPLFLSFFLSFLIWGFCLARCAVHGLLPSADGEPRGGEVGRGVHHWRCPWPRHGAVSSMSTIRMQSVYLSVW